MPCYLTLSPLPCLSLILHSHLKSMHHYNSTLLDGQDRFAPAHITIESVTTNCNLQIKLFPVYW